MKSVEIRTERLVLRPLGTEYLQTFCEFALDVENTKYMCFFPKEDSEEALHFLQDAEREWEKERPAFVEFAMLYEGRHIGTATVYFEEGFGELAWLVNRKYWGNGFAYEAAKALIAYTKSTYGTTRFHACCDSENVASYKTMEKLGMTKIGECTRRNRAATQDSLEYQYEMVV